MPLPEDIIGSLPPPIDEIEEVDHDSLPELIVGSLPSPQAIRSELPSFTHAGVHHRVNHTHFTPDGKIVNCACGWQSHECRDEELALEWIDHG